MNEWYYLLTSSTVYNHKSLHVIDFGEEFNTWLRLDENIDIVNDALQLCQHILKILSGFVDTSIQPDEHKIL